MYECYTGKMDEKSYKQLVVCSFWGDCNCAKLQMCDSQRFKKKLDIYTNIKFLTVFRL